MEEDGSTPDTAAFQAALDVLKDAAQWEKAMDVISEMDELGVRKRKVFGSCVPFFRLVRHSKFVVRLWSTYLVNLSMVKQCQCCQNIDLAAFYYWQ